MEALVSWEHQAWKTNWAWVGGWLVPENVLSVIDILFKWQWDPYLFTLLNFYEKNEYFSFSFLPLYGFATHTHTHAHAHAHAHTHTHTHTHTEIEQWNKSSMISSFWDLKAITTNDFFLISFNAQSFGHYLKA